MCWRTKITPELAPSVVKKDEKFITYKVMIPTGSSSILKSLVAGFEYELGKQYKIDEDSIKNELVDLSGYYFIKDSAVYHSYLVDSVKFKGINVFNEPIIALLDSNKHEIATAGEPETVLVKCRIPEGAQYLLGDDNEIVSKELIIESVLIGASSLKGLEYIKYLLAFISSLIIPFFFSGALSLLVIALILLFNKVGVLIILALIIIMLLIFKD